MHLVKRVKNKVNSWHKKEYVPKLVRDSVQGNIVSIGMAEIAAYKIISQDVEVGNLPASTPYLAIPLVAIVQACLGPLLSWLGYKTRRKMVLNCSIAMMIIPWAWIVIPTASTVVESEFCNSTIVNTPIIFDTLTITTSIRLMVVLATSICFCVLRVAIWSHFMAYSDDQVPGRTSVHMGIFIIACILPLIFNIFLSNFVGTLNNLLSILFVVVFIIVNTSRMYFTFPKTDILSVDRGFFQSLKRVLLNKIAMSQMISTGLLAGALWGFGYNEDEIIKINYNIFHEMEILLDTITHFLRLCIAILAVVYVGVKLSAPIRMEFDSIKALQVATKMSIIAILIYILIVTVSPCNKGLIAGLESEQYSNPQCSLSCGCIDRWKEFSPVCVVDTMTTYLSPCQAGCADFEAIEGLKVFTNCSCSSSGRALAGACSDGSCQIGYHFHKMTFCIIITVSVVAIQAQSMVVLKTVEARDKSVAMGVMWSMVAIIAFVISNTVYYFIGSNTCIWFAGGKCQLHNVWFSYAAGFVGAAFVFLAVVINIFAKRSLRRQLDKRSEDDPSSA